MILEVPLPSFKGCPIRGLGGAQVVVEGVPKTRFKGRRKPERGGVRKPEAAPLAYRVVYGGS